MHLRPVERSDLPACASISAAASIDDPLFAYLCPKRIEYPDSWWRFMFESARSHFVRRESWGTVCVSDELDEGDPGKQEEVLGYAFWQRVPATKYSYAEQAWIPKNVSLASAFERLLLGVESVYKSITPYNIPAANQSRVVAFYNSLKIQQPFFPLKYGYWELKVLAVNPQHQRRGIGSALLGWGLEHATRERVPATVIANAKGKELYSKKGFKVIDALYVPGLDQADPAMIWNPRKQWARDLGGAKDVQKLGVKMEAVWTDKAKEGLDDLERAKLPNFEWSELFWRRG